MIQLTLNWLNLISIEKKHGRQQQMDTDDCTVSVVYSLLKTKSKAHIFKNIFKILEICSKHAFAWA